MTDVSSADVLTAWRLALEGEPQRTAEPFKTCTAIRFRCSGVICRCAVYRRRRWDWLSPLPSPRAHTQHSDGLLWPGDIVVSYAHYANAPPGLPWWYVATFGRLEMLRGRRMPRNRWRLTLEGADGELIVPDPLRQMRARERWLRLSRAKSRRKEK